MSFKKKSRIIASIMLIAAIAFFVFAITHPTARFPLEQYHNIFHLCRLHFNHGAAVCSSLQKGKINAAANEYTKWNNVILREHKSELGKKI